MQSDDAAYAIDKCWARRSFDRAGATYDDAAVLQTEVRNRLLERLELTALAPRLVLDVGCGTGHAGRALKRRYPGARVIAVDFSMGMLKAAGRGRPWRRPVMRLCADAEQLPLAARGVDLILSNLMLPWGDPDRVFAEFRRVLAPRGLLTFTTLGPDTLKELRAAWRCTGGGAHSRVNRFFDMHDIGDALVRAGFAAPVLDVERYTLRYENVRRLAADLKALGTRNATAGRLKGLTGPRRFAAMESVYERHRVEGRLPASYEVVFGQAWAPTEGRSRGGPATEVPLEELKRQLQRRRG